MRFNVTMLGECLEMLKADIGMVRGGVFRILVRMGYTKCYSCSAFHGGSTTETWYPERLKIYARRRKECMNDNSSIGRCQAMILDYAINPSTPQAPVPCS